MMRVHEGAMLLGLVLVVGCGGLASRVTESGKQRAREALDKSYDRSTFEAMPADQVLEIAFALPHVLTRRNEKNFQAVRAALLESLRKPSDDPGWKGGHLLQQICAYYPLLDGSPYVLDGEQKKNERGEPFIWTNHKSWAIGLMALISEEWNSGIPLEWKKKLAAQIAGYLTDSSSAPLLPAHISKLGLPKRDNYALAINQFVVVNEDGSFYVQAAGCAALTLALMKASEHAPFIAARLGEPTHDDETQHCFILALKRLNAKDQASSLAQLLTYAPESDSYRNGKKIRLATHAALVLADMGCKEYAPQARRLFQQPHLRSADSQFRSGTLSDTLFEALVRLNAELPHEEVVAYIKETMARQNDSAARHAFSYLKSRSASMPIQDIIAWSLDTFGLNLFGLWGTLSPEILRPMLEDPSPRMRRAGVIATLLCDNSAEAGKMAYASLKDPDAFTRHAAQARLGLRPFDAIGGQPAQWKSEWLRWKEVAPDIAWDYVRDRVRRQPAQALELALAFQADLDSLADPLRTLQKDGGGPERLAVVDYAGKLPGSRELKLSFLLAALEDKEAAARQSAAAALVEIDAALLAQKSGQIVRDPSLDVRLFFYRALGRMKLDAERESELMALWSADADPRLRVEFEKRLEAVDPAVLSKTGDRLLKDADPALRGRYFRIARRRLEAGQETGLLDRWLADPEPAVRLELVGILEDIPPDVLAGRADRIAKDPSEAVRTLFFGKLGGTRLPRSTRVQLCAAGLADPAVPVAAQAIRGLAKEGAKQSSKDLLPFLSSRHPELRAAALEALGTFKDAESEEAMVDALDADDARVRAAAMRALGALGAKERGEMVAQKFLSEPDAGARAAAADALRSLGRTLRSPDLFKLVAPSVVHISAAFKQGGGTGSGFIVDPKGLVLTNRHVIEARDGSPAELLVIRLYQDERSYPCRVLRRHADRDLALLEITAPPRNMPSLGFSEVRPEIGEELVVIGHPKGQDWSLTEGRVSQFRTMPKWGEVIQTDAAINPGNSGGPMVNKYGQLVGVATFILREAEGLNFGITASVARQFLDKRE